MAVYVPRYPQVQLDGARLLQRALFRKFQQYRSDTGALLYLDSYDIFRGTRSIKRTLQPVVTARRRPCQQHDEHQQQQHEPAHAATHLRAHPAAAPTLTAGGG